MGSIRDRRRDSRQTKNSKKPSTKRRLKLQSFVIKKVSCWWNSYSQEPREKYYDDYGKPFKTKEEEWSLLELYLSMTTLVLTMLIWRNGFLTGIQHWSSTDQLSTVPRNEEDAVETHQGMQHWSSADQLSSVHRIEDAVETHYKSLATSFYQEGIRKLGHQHDKCHKLFHYCHQFYCYSTLEVEKKTAFVNYKQYCKYAYQLLHKINIIIEFSIDCETNKIIKTIVMTVAKETPFHYCWKFLNFRYCNDHCSYFLSTNLESLCR